jgi:hypothetical protein
MTYIPNSPEPTFYSQRARDNWLKSKADYEKAQQVARERADRERLIENNSREAANRAIQQEQLNKPAAQPSISWSEYYRP